MIPTYPYIGSKRQCEEVPVAFPPQHQNCQPGMEYCMNPRPISENTCQKGRRLEGKCAVISGGDSGIGRAVAYAFVKEGASVMLLYYNEERDAVETREHIEKMGGCCWIYSCDLREKCSVSAAVAKAAERMGTIDVLVNNHAVQFIQRDILDISEEQLKLTFQTNILSYFYMVQAALPYMDCGSSIINTTSVTAYQGNRNLIDYSATKGAVTAFTRSLALSLAPQQIRVNGVAPGPIWTPLIPASYSAKEVETFGTETSKVPMMRAGQPFEVAPCYVFLASNDASYMTGQVLHPNGGTIAGS